MLRYTAQINSIESGSERKLTSWALKSMNTKIRWLYKYTHATVTFGIKLRMEKKEFTTKVCWVQWEIGEIVVVNNECCKVHTEKVKEEPRHFGSMVGGRAGLIFFFSRLGQDECFLTIIVTLVLNFSLHWISPLWICVLLCVLHHTILWHLALPIPSINVVSIFPPHSLTFSAHPPPTPPLSRHQPLS